MADVLCTFTRPPDQHDRARVREDPAWLPPHGAVVGAADGAEVPLATVRDLMTEVADRVDAGRWAADRAASDRWLAPRLHWALRLTRAQGADPLMWLWLALQFPDYVTWRWDGTKGVTEDRWLGPVHKQAFSRLWWGGEIFRDGPDYSPVERAFVRQDLPNSYLHRPMVRCRPLALALVDVAAPAGRETEVSADEVNDLARAVNLATAGAPPESEIGGGADDVAAYLGWVARPAPHPEDWDRLPEGPPCADTTPEALERAAGIAERCAGWAHTAALARGARSALRRSGREPGPDVSVQPPRIDTDPPASGGSRARGPVS